MPVESKIRIPLNHDFRYFHEPVSGSLAGKWAVGRDQLAEELADRIVLSRGGAFLVGGLRGVGKTTFVRLAMHAIRSSDGRYANSVGAFELVDVWLNISRTLEPVQLLHLVIRHLYLRIKEMNLLTRLDDELRKDLNTAFMRTAFEISSRKLNEEERGRSSEVGFGKAPWIGIEFLGKLSASYKRSRTDEEALKYLPYDEKAAEFDILNFARRLQEATPQREPLLRRLLRPFRGAPLTPPSIRVVFVLDELDKLESASAVSGVSVLDPILQALKTVFSASGFSFVFVGGKEVEERMIEDISHADSIYESIFAYNLYLPCLWDDQGQILAQCMAREQLPQSRDAASYWGIVERYLRYKGRGIPRRTWREVNKYVWWDEEGPSLILDVKSRRYMELFSKLEEGLQDDPLFNALEQIADNVRRDRQRLYFYYTADWVLTRGRESFTTDEVMAMVLTLNLGGALTPVAARKIAGSTLDILRNRAFVQIDTERTRVILPTEALCYRLSPWVLRTFEGFAEEEKKVEAAPSGDHKQNGEDLVQIGHYQILEMISSGGMSHVYKVRHAISGGLRAAKMLTARFAGQPGMIESFHKESLALEKLSHPGLIQTYESGMCNGRPYYIMDLLEGITLGTLLDNVKTLGVPVACRIASEAALILAYLHQQRLVHRDIKPTNVFLTRSGAVKILDLGIAVSVGSPFENLNDASSLLVPGTPGYAAPEQFLGKVKPDARLDIYSLGATLFEMLTGQLPFGRQDARPSPANPGEIAPSLSNALPGIPAKLAEAVTRALAEPSERYATIQAFHDDLMPFASRDSEVVKQIIRSVSSSTISARELTLASIAHDAAPVPSTATPATEPAVPGSRAADVHSTLTERNWSMIRTGSRLEQESAFRQLCVLSFNTGEAHLLFDLARELCLWGGQGAISRSILMHEGRLILGRSASEVDLPLDAPDISRQHLAIFYLKDNGTITVEDLSSAAGSRLNGRRLGRHEVADGDYLTVGASEIMVHLLSATRTYLTDRPSVADL